MPDGINIPYGGQISVHVQMNGNISVASNTLTTEFALVAGGNMFSSVTAASYKTSYTTPSKRYGSGKPEPYHI